MSRTSAVAGGLSVTSLIPILLRVGFAMCFIGHGAFGLLQKRDWLSFFAPFGIGEPAALTLMPLIGTIDITIGVAALLLPLRAVFLYGVVWCVFTAALRPMAAQSVGELLERAGNYGIPLALLVATSGQRWLARIRTDGIGTPGLDRVAIVCLWTTATLLVGHGWLALEGKPLLQQHAALLGLSAAAVPFVGGIEVVLAILCLVRPSKPLLLAVSLWKVASESLFSLAGAPIWEFVERGGSYVAPLIAALTLDSRRVSLPSNRVRVAATASAVLAWTLVSFAQAPATPSADLLNQLRSGGFVFACRHAITSHDREDRMPVNFDDPSTQRVLSPEGEEQATVLGKNLATLNIRFGVVVASPFDRTRRSAELMAGRVQTDDALSSMARDKTAELRALITGPVEPKTNRLVVTHQGLIYRVLRTVKQGSVAEGDCVIVRPNDTGADVIAIVKPEDWSRAARQQ